MKPLLLLLAGLAMAEALAWWWMHPAPTGLDRPTLAYVPPHESSTRPHDRITVLPELVAEASRSLRCSRGMAARHDRYDGSQIHFAFLEWDFTDAGSVFEAFKHLPDECLGAIGMKLLEVGEPRRFDLDGETLWFDHTIFRDPSGAIVHAFKGTWLSGVGDLPRKNARTGDVPWRTLRWKAAASRFRPAYARVAQGAVRGIPHPDLAWDAFRAGPLADLSFASSDR